ncbi:MAG: phosphopantetheine-binding protein, partial [Methylocella sp.]
AFPLTGTGKIDRLALSRQAANARAQNPSNTKFAAPVEAMLIDLWRRHLQLETVGLDQNFFDLGGSSLQLLGVHADIERRFPGQISIKDLFDLPTIRLLHSRLSGGPAADATAQAAAHAALQRRARQNRARSSSVNANPATGN